MDDEEDNVVVENGKAIVPKDNRQVMGNKWEKAGATLMLRLPKCVNMDGHFFR